MAKISVLIVSRNYGRFLRQCIDSVLAQTCRVELEIVLVDEELGFRADTACFNLLTGATPAE